MALDPIFNEGFLSRGWRDTKSTVHSFWFWGLEVGGGALTGFLDPILAPIWVGGVFVAVWLGATAGAPFRQRNEARTALDDAQRSIQMAATPPPSPWVDLTTASQIWEDCIRQEGVSVFSASVYLDVGGIGGPEMAFIQYLVNGANAGYIQVRGRPQFGRQIIPVPIPMDTPNHGLGDATHDVVGADGSRYGNLEINTDGIKEYVNWLKTDD